MITNYVRFVGGKLAPCEEWPFPVPQSEGPDDWVPWITKHGKYRKEDDVGDPHYDGHYEIFGTEKEGWPRYLILWHLELTPFIVLDSQLALLLFRAFASPIVQTELLLTMGAEVEAITKHLCGHVGGIRCPECSKAEKAWGG